MNPSFSPVWVVIFAGCAAVVVPIILGVQQSSRKRAYEHTERMKALEMGMAPPGDNAWAAAVCIAIGAVVPIAAMGIAMVVTLVTQKSMGHDHAALAWSSHQFEEFHGILWGCATAVGVLSVIGGVLLSFRLLGGRRRTAERPTGDVFAQDLQAKPSFDPDAYDTVSRRG
jgi:hypothetical protein